MLCSKCYKKIPQEEEIQINGTIFCKMCAESSATERNTFTKCNFCQESVFNNEPIHEVYEKWGSQVSEKLTTCQSCYEKWLKIANLKGKTWNLKDWFYKIFLPFSMWFVVAIITVSKNEEHAGKGPVFIMLVLSTSIMLLSPLFLEIVLFIYRKILERKYKKEQRIVKQKEKNFRKKKNDNDNKY